MKRHTCIICGRKRKEIYMKNVFSKSWACSRSVSRWSIACICSDSNEIREAIEVIKIVSKWKNVSIKHLA